MSAIELRDRIHGLMATARHPVRVLDGKVVIEACIPGDPPLTQDMMEGQSVTCPYCRMIFTGRRLVE